MLRVAVCMLAFGVCGNMLLFNHGMSRVAAQSATQAACPVTTEEENVALARAWHEEVINRRNPEALQDILAPEIEHQAAGGYPKTLDEGA